MVAEIQSEASSLGRGLHPGTVVELADLVRLMNCYYSNLIEGHNTRPRDIERALDGAVLDDTRRPLALEARAHVLVHREIDRAFAAGTLPQPTSAAFLVWVHRRFSEEMPAEFSEVTGPDGAPRPVAAGRFRSEPVDEAAVGRHVPPSCARIPDFMACFERRFAAAERWPSARVIAIASAHHRLNYIHPFVDGNGRVSRLMSHAMVLRSGIGGGGLWSISRGLARGLGERGEYKQMMDHADSPRQGDRDGRGNLSERALKDFCEWMLSVMLDQIRFTRTAFALDTMDDRYRRLLRDLGYHERSQDLASAALRFGEIARGDAPLVLKTSERSARNTLSSMVRDGFLKAASPKGPVRIAFPLRYRDRLFPNLFADESIDAPVPSATSLGA